MDSFITNSEAMNDDLLRAVSKYARPVIDMTLVDLSKEMQDLLQLQTKNANMLEHWQDHISNMQLYEQNLQATIAKQEEALTAMQAAQTLAEETRTTSTRDRAERAAKRVKNADWVMYRALEEDYLEKQLVYSAELEQAQMQHKCLLLMDQEVEDAIDSYEQKQQVIQRAIDSELTCTSCNGKLICFTDDEGDVEALPQ